MPRHALKKDKWTITFDHELKQQVRKEAKKLRIYPVQLLETLVREKLNPYGFQSVRSGIAYENSMRRKSRHISDKKFLQEIRQWEKK